MEKGTHYPARALAFPGPASQAAGQASNHMELASGKSYLKAQRSGPAFDTHS